MPLRHRAAFNVLFVLQHWLRNSQALRRRKAAARARIVAHVRRGGPGKIVPVERRTDLTPREFRARYLRRGIPVILEGGAREWPCVREWSFASFRQRFGRETVKFVRRPGAPDDDGSAGAQGYCEESFGEFLDGALSGSGGKYLRSPLLEKFPELRQDFDQGFLRDMPGSTMGVTYQLFIGGRGTATPLHNAITPCFFVNTCGIKRWHFIPGDYLAVLDPSPDGLPYNHSAADLGFANLDRYPGLDCIDRLEAVMQPGDILFHPSWMWHAVQNESPTIGVRYGFVYPPGMLAEAPALTFIRAFAGNPSMLKTAWYSFFNTDLPDRETLLDTPKVFAPGAAPHRRAPADDEAVDPTR
ncbi:MAG: cupin-like domain-containing protein [Candidatus Binatia bacterium]